jgi:hypothetical protein
MFLQVYLEKKVQDLRDELRQKDHVLRSQESILEYVAGSEAQLQAAGDDMAQQTEIIRSMNADDKRSKKQLQDK